MYQNLFERIERDKAARVEFIRKINVDQRVIELLLALDDLSDALPSAVTLPDGTRELSAPLSVLEWRMARTTNTVRSYIDLATESGFVQVIASNHKPHRFRILWQAIAASSRPVELTHQRGSTRRLEGVNQGVKRGSVSPPQLTPSPDLDLGVLRSEEKYKYPDPDLEGGGQAKRPLAGWKAFWSRWKSAISSRDLTCPSDVQFLYELAIAEGLFEESEMNRLRVFALAAHDVRLAKKRGWLFKENVAYCSWDRASCEDEGVARKMIRLLDRDADAVREFTELRPALKWYLECGGEERAKDWCSLALRTPLDDWAKFSQTHARSIESLKKAYEEQRMVKGAT